MFLQIYAGMLGLLTVEFGTHNLYGTTQNSSLKKIRQDEKTHEADQGCTNHKEGQIDRIDKAGRQTSRWADASTERNPETRVARQYEQGYCPPPRDQCQDGRGASIQSDAATEGS